jgi:hypothetical protein
MYFTIEIFGDKQVDRELLRFRDRAMNMEPAFRALAADFLEEEAKQFDTEGAYASGGWVPLRPSTIAKKAAAGQDLRILHATNAMSRSLTVPGAPGQIRRIKRDEMFVGTDVRSKKGFPYPAVHQRPIRSPLPRRRPVELRATTRREWIRRLQHYLVHGLVK